jgi:glutaredoxin
MMTVAQIKMYGTAWCPDTQRARKFLENHRIPYMWYDIDHDNEARAFVEKVNEGKRCVPTIVFPDGYILVEPRDSELEKQLTGGK